MRNGQKLKTKKQQTKITTMICKQNDYKKNDYKKNEEQHAIKIKNLNLPKIFFASFENKKIVWLCLLFLIYSSLSFLVFTLIGSLRR